VANIESLQRQVESSEHKPRLLVSVITLGEIEFGHRVNSSVDSGVQRDYRKFVSEELAVSLEVSEDATIHFGEIRKRLFDKYAPGRKRRPKMRPEQLIEPITSKELGIQENDLWLCAQAVGHGMILVTNDGMHRIREVTQDLQPPLLIQNWAIPNTARIE
jgi:predicted nucleic acid-binding protein